MTFQNLSFCVTQKNTTTQKHKTKHEFGTRPRVGLLGKLLLLLEAPILMALALTWFWTYNLAINFNQSTTSPLIWDSHNAPLIVHHSKLSEHKLKNVILKIKCLQFIDLLEHFLFQWAWWDDNGKHKCMNPAVELRAIASVVKGGADYRGPWLWGVPLWFQPTASTEQLMNHCCTSSQKLIICMCFYALPI